MTIKLASELELPVFSGRPEERCKGCDATFDHTPECCALRRVADALESIIDRLSDINTELEKARHER